MKRFLFLLVLVLLPGCAVTLHGNQTTGGGSTATTTGSSVQAGKQFGNARVGGSFGSPPAAQAAGGQLRLSSGASAVLVVGLVIAGTVEAISDWMRPAAQRAERLPTGNISQTCSCYASNPELTSEAAAQ
ncbi:MAG: hypothetical protein K2X06_07775 [Burkholderiales bacterium]|nr:hypothetical protein [Burkholderiales bacterium]